MSDEIGTPARPLRVCLLQPALPKYRIPVFREFAARPGIDLEVLYSDDEPVPSVEPDGFRARKVESQLLLKSPRLLWSPAHADVLRGNQYDVVIMGWNTRYLSLIPALVRARTSRVATVLWGHGYSKTETNVRQMLRDRVGSLADAIIFYGRSACNRFRDRNPDARRLFVARNALDQTEIARCRDEALADPAALARFRAEHNLDRGPVLFFVSRLIRENRLDLLLDAVARLRPDFPGLRLVIVGGGPATQELQAQTASLNLGDSVTFTGPIYEERRLADWFVCSDLFVYPRNIGLSLHHAMGYGLPVITSDDEAAWAPEVDALRPFFNGMIYRDGDAEDLARVIRLTLEDPTRVALMREQALRSSCHEHTLSRMVDGLEEAARSAFAAKHPRAGLAAQTA